MKVYLPFMDSHRVHLIYYKIAGLYFIQKKFNEALEYINKVVIIPIDYLRNDLEINARLLHILCNYELNNFDLINDYLLPALEKSILKAKDSGNVQKAMVHLLKKLIRQNTFLQKKSIEDFYLNFPNISNDPYAIKEIAYFDVPKWLQLHLNFPITN
jgi:tetratricopeptide (TPR) repeat protein